MALAENIPDMPALGSTYSSMLLWLVIVTVLAVAAVPAVTPPEPIRIAPMSSFLIVMLPEAVFTPSRIRSLGRSKTRFSPPPAAVASAENWFTRSMFVRLNEPSNDAADSARASASSTVAVGSAGSALRITPAAVSEIFEPSMKAPPPTCTLPTVRSRPLVSVTVPSAVATVTD